MNARDTSYDLKYWISLSFLFLLICHLSLKEEWDLKEDVSPAVFIEVSLEVKQEDPEDSSVFHSIDEDCTTNINKVII